MTLLRDVPSLLNGLFLTAIKNSPFVRDGLRNQARWEKRLDALSRGRDA